ncbi:hypothetical protein BOX37_22785 [Nocardia mangyaensis]|uniref:Uncharacterized protein n=1 Tax=Nocardia mangyaensis TaxID=2213200 RepID=A0A1J0VW65_9NOCA|nr:hypothetical protein BOX37_22785 [Nocardia mangyaensis]
MADEHDRAGIDVVEHVGEPARVPVHPVAPWPPIGAHPGLAGQVGDDGVPPAGECVEQIE